MDNIIKKIKLDKELSNEESFFLGELFFKSHLKNILNLIKRKYYEIDISYFYNLILSYLENPNNFNDLKKIGNINFNDLNKESKKYFIELGINLIKTGVMELV